MTTPENKCGAVVVTYHPDLQFEQRLVLIAREVAAVVIVDNSADRGVRRRLELLGEQQECILIFNGQNLGLAAALNLGFAALEQRGFSQVIAFDQDSTPAPDFSLALTATATGPGDGRIAAIVGANWRDKARTDQPARHLQAHPFIPFLFRRVVTVRDLSDVTCVITSGTLFQLSAWRQLDGFDEKLFLDLVDTDYCLRARAAGMAVRVSASACLAHQRGAKRPIRLAGKTWWPAFMPPARLHGLFRNRVALFRRHAWRHPHWVAFEFTYATKIVGEIISLEDRKWAKLSACLCGLWDGLLGRSGPIVNTPR